MTLSAVRASMATTIVLCYGALVVRGDDAQHEFSTPGSAVVCAGEQLGQLAVRMPLNLANDTPAYYFVALSREGDRLVPRGQPGRVMPVQPGVPGAAMPMHPTALKLAGERWAIVTDTFGGGAWVLQLANVRGDLMAVNSKNVPVSGKDVQIIHYIEVARPTTDRTLDDLTGPRLLEHDGRLFIIVSTTGLTTGKAPEILIAEARVESGTLRGRVIGQGFCPRVAKLGTDFVCAMRYADRYPDTSDPATPIRFYRSSDLENWAPMPSPDQTLKFTRYDLAADADTLWLLGVAQEEQKTVGKLLKFDSQAQTWTATDAGLTIPSTRSEVRLLPKSPQRPKLTAVIPDESGGLTVSELRAQ